MIINIKNKSFLINHKKYFSVYYIINYFDDICITRVICHTSFIFVQSKYSNVNESRRLSYSK